MPEQNLLPGEYLNFDTQTAESILNKSDVAINEKYMKGELRIVTEQARYPLNTIAAMVASDDYELNPEFQRRFRWSPEKQSKLMESFIMNVPVPPIFLYEDSFSHYEVMDGLQRLTAIQEFYTNGFALEGLEEWPELNGRRYKDLPDQIRRGIDRRYLSSIILLQETAKTERQAQELKQLVFERINTGGEELKGQESRNAIYNGPLNQLCIKLSKNRNLCLTWGIPLPTEQEILGGLPSRERLANKHYKKMDDVELVLRFFGFRQRAQHTWNSIEKYLDRYLSFGNTYSPEVLEDLSALFDQTIALVFSVFGEDAFRLWRQGRTGRWDWTSEPSQVVYDALMNVFSHNLYRSAEILEKKEQFKGEISNFYERNPDSFAGRGVNKTDFERRVEQYSAFIDQMLAE